MLGRRGANSAARALVGVMNEPTTDPAVERYTAALVGGACQFDAILDHMARFMASGESQAVDPPDVILLHVVQGILVERLPGRFTPDQIAAASDVLEAALTAVGEDLFLVDPDAVAPGGRIRSLPRRRSRKGGRRRG